MNIKFSHKPYTPFGAPDGIFVTRLAPYTDGISLSWLGNDRNDRNDNSYDICIFEGEKLVKKLSTNENTAEIHGLSENTDYTLTVSCGEKCSLRRLFTTGDYHGDVINYLHQNDLQYEYSGRYLATPHIVRFKGDLYVSTDCFHGGDQKGGYNLTLLFRSRDNGHSWEYVCDLVPAFWGSLFVANDKLCILAVTTEFGSLVVSESEDGENWSSPTMLIYGNGSGYGVGAHKSSTPPTYFDGKIYFGLEYGGYPAKEFCPFIGVLNLSKPTLDPSAWTFSDFFHVQFEWGGDQTYRFAIEGNTVEKDGEIYDILRFAAGRALMLKYDKNHPEKAPVLHKILDLPIGHCKFYIQKDADGTYYAMGNSVCYPRHVLQLYRSKDLENWEFVKTLDDISSLSKDDDGIQYPSYLIEDGKFLTVLRIALNGAHNFHDSNAITFRVFEK